MNPKPKKRRQTKYFIKESNEIYMVKPSYFDQLTSRQEAVNVAVQVYLEINRILKEEALFNDVSYIGNMKVITGLERSLNELERRFPKIIDEIRSIDRLCEGQRIFRC